jgi:hypothetical protein
MKWVVAVLVVSLAACLAGCFPSWPRMTPGVDGLVLREGQPVQGASVYMVSWPRNGECKSSPLMAVTSSTGQFSIRGTRQFEWAVYGDRLASWAVCIREAGVWYMGYEQSSMGSPPSKVALTCELADTPETHRGSRWARGLCHAH